jgi:hypothetical protein
MTDRSFFMFIVGPYRSSLSFSRWWATGHPLAPTRLANDAGASSAARSGKTQGEGMSLHFPQSSQIELSVDSQ